MSGGKARDHHEINQRCSGDEEFRRAHTKPTQLWEGGSGQRSVASSVKHVQAAQDTVLANADSTRLTARSRLLLQ